MHADHIDVLRACAEEIGAAVADHRGRGYSGLRDTQYHLDVVADEVALRVLGGAGLRVVSEESGVSGHGDLTVVVDPIDGSTNCDRGIPFYSTSLALLRHGVLVAGVVKNQATGEVFCAEHGAGATRDGRPIHVSGRTEPASAIAGYSGYPALDLGWWQMRALGAASLEICLVADGSIDLFGVAGRSTLNPWDYLAGVAIALEAGASVADLRGEDLVTDDAVLRRPVVAATPELLAVAMGAGEI